MIKKLISIFLTFALIWTSGNAAQAAAFAPEVFVGPSDLPQFRLIPPAKLGKIVDYFNAQNNQKLVILIQDLHANYGVQKNIAGILDFLSDKLTPASSLRPPFALAVEGAAGPIDSSVMALFPDAKIKEAASQYLMREGELTGTEYFAIKRSIPNLLVGVENGDYYNVHRDLFRKTLENREQLVQALTQIQTDITTLPRRVYSRELKSFQAKIDAFEKGEITSEEFIGFLSTEAKARGIDIKTDFPALAAFASNVNALSPDALRELTAQFLQSAANYFSPQERKNLTVLAKEADNTPYYLYLRELIYQHQLFLAAPPELARHLEYVHTAETLGLDQVLHEANELAFLLKSRIAGTQQEKDLVQVQHDLGLLIRLANLQATEFEVRDFAPRLNQFVALTKALLSKDTSFDEPSIRRLISSSIDYYVMAMLRNTPMADNTLALIGQQKTAVLITGGFHTAPLTQLLRERNVSYLVICPNVESLTDADEKLYVKRLNGQLLTNDEILAAVQKDIDPPDMPRTWVARLKNTFARDGEGKGLATGIWGPVLGASLLLFGLGSYARANNLPPVKALPAFEQKYLQGYSEPAKSQVHQWVHDTETYLLAQAQAVQQPGFNQAAHSAEALRKNSYILEGLQGEALLARLKTEIEDFYTRRGVDIKTLDITVADIPNYGAGTSIAINQTSSGRSAASPIKLTVSTSQLVQPDKGFSRVRENTILMHEYYHFNFALTLDDRKAAVLEQIHDRLRPRKNPAKFEKEWENRISKAIRKALNHIEDFHAETFAWQDVQKNFQEIDPADLQSHEQILALSDEQTAEDLQALTKAQRSIVQTILITYKDEGPINTQAVSDIKKTDATIKQVDAWNWQQFKDQSPTPEILQKLRDMILQFVHGEADSDIGVFSVDFHRTEPTYDEKGQRRISPMFSATGQDSTTKVPQTSINVNLAYWFSPTYPDVWDQDQMEFSLEHELAHLKLEKLNPGVQGRIVSKVQEETGDHSAETQNLLTMALWAQAEADCDNSANSVFRSRHSHDIDTLEKSITYYQDAYSEAVAAMPALVRESFQKILPNEPAVNDTARLPAALLQAPLTHPETYTAGVIRYRLGRWALLKWRYFRWTGNWDGERTMVVQAGLDPTRPSKDQLVGENEKRFILLKFGPRIEQRYFWIKKIALAFTDSHAEKEHNITRREGAEAIFGATWKGVLDGFIRGASAGFIIDAVFFLMWVSSYSDTGVTFSPLVSTLAGVAFALAVSLVTGYFNGRQAGRAEHSFYNALHYDDGAELTAGAKPAMQETWRPSSVETSVAAANSHLRITLGRDLNPDEIQKVMQKAHSENISVLQAAMSLYRQTSSPAFLDKVFGYRDPKGALLFYWPTRQTDQGIYAVRILSDGELIGGEKLFSPNELIKRAAWQPFSIREGSLFVGRGGVLYRVVKYNPSFGFYWSRKADATSQSSDLSDAIPFPEGFIRTSWFKNRIPEPRPKTIAAAAGAGASISAAQMSVNSSGSIAKKVVPLVLVAIGIGIALYGMITGDYAAAHQGVSMAFLPFFRMPSFVRNWPERLGILPPVPLEETRLGENQTETTPFQRAQATALMMLAGLVAPLSPIEQPLKGKPTALIEPPDEANLGRAPPADIRRFIDALNVIRGRISQRQLDILLNNESPLFPKLPKEDILRILYQHADRLQPDAQQLLREISPNPPDEPLRFIQDNDFNIGLKDHLQQLAEVGRNIFIGDFQPSQLRSLLEPIRESAKMGPLKGTPVDDTFGFELEFQIKDQIGVPRDESLPPDEWQRRRNAILMPLTRLIDEFGWEMDSNRNQNFMEIRTPVFDKDPGSWERFKTQLAAIQAALPGGFISVHMHVGRRSLTKEIYGQKRLDIDVGRFARLGKVFEAQWRALAGRRFTRAETSMRVRPLNANALHDATDAESHDAILNLSWMHPTIEIKIITGHLQNNQMLDIDSIEENTAWAFALLDAVAPAEESMPLAVLGIPAIAGEKPSPEQLEHFIDLLFSKDPEGAAKARAVFESLANEPEGLTQAEIDAEHQKIRAVFESIGLGVIYDLHRAHGGYFAGLIDHLLTHQEVLDDLAQDLLAADQRLNVTQEQKEERALGFFPVEIHEALRAAMRRVPATRPIPTVSPEILARYADILQPASIDSIRLRGLMDDIRTDRIQIRRLQELVERERTTTNEQILRAAERASRETMDLWTQENAVYTPRTEPLLRVEQIRYTPGRTTRAFAKKSPYGIPALITGALVAGVGLVLMAGGLISVDDFHQLLNTVLLGAAGYVVFANLYRGFLQIVHKGFEISPQYAPDENAVRQQVSELIGRLFGTQRLDRMEIQPVTQMLETEPGIFELEILPSLAPNPEEQLRILDQFHEGYYFDPQERILYVRRSSDGFALPQFMNNALYDIFARKLFVLESATRNPDWDLGLVLAHEMGKQDFFDALQYGGPFTRQLAELTGNLYELAHFFGIPQRMGPFAMQRVAVLLAQLTDQFRSSVFGVASFISSLIYSPETLAFPGTVVSLLVTQIQSAWRSFHITPGREDVETTEYNDEIIHPDFPQFNWPELRLEPLNIDLQTYRIQPHWSLIALNTLLALFGLTPVNNLSDIRDAWLAQAPNMAIAWIIGLGLSLSIESMHDFALPLILIAIVANVGIVAKAAWQLWSEPPAGTQKAVSVSIEIPTPLQKFVDGRDSVAVTARTPEEAVRELANQYPDVKRYLLDDEGKPRGFLRLAVNDEILEPWENPILQEHDVLSLVPVIQGGNGERDDSAPEHDTDLTNSLGFKLIAAAYLFEQGSKSAAHALLVTSGPITNTANETNLLTFLRQRRLTPSGFVDLINQQITERPGDFAATPDGKYGRALLPFVGYISTKQGRNGRREADAALRDFTKRLSTRGAAALSPASTAQPQGEPEALSPEIQDWAGEIAVEAADSIWPERVRQFVASQKSLANINQENARIFMQIDILTVIGSLKPEFREARQSQLVTELMGWGLDASRAIAVVQAATALGENQVNLRERLLSYMEDRLKGEHPDSRALEEQLIQDHALSVDQAHHILTQVEAALAAGPPASRSEGPGLAKDASLLILLPLGASFINPGLGIAAGLLVAMALAWIFRSQLRQSISRLISPSSPAGNTQPIAPLAENAAPGQAFKALNTPLSEADQTATATETGVKVLQDAGYSPAEVDHWSRMMEDSYTRHPGDKFPPPSASDERIGVTLIKNRIPINRDIAKQIRQQFTPNTSGHYDAEAGRLIANTPELARLIYLLAHWNEGSETLLNLLRSTPPASITSSMVKAALEANFSINKVDDLYRQAGLTSEDPLPDFDANKELLIAFAALTPVPHDAQLAELYSALYSSIKMGQREEVAQASEDFQKTYGEEGYKITLETIRQELGMTQVEIERLTTPFYWLNTRPAKVVAFLLSMTFGILLLYLLTNKLGVLKESSTPPQETGSYDYGIREDDSLGLTTRQKHDEFNAALGEIVRAIGGEQVKLGLRVSQNGLYDYRGYARARKATYQDPIQANDGKQKIWIEPDGMVIIIDPRLEGFDHAGRGAWTVYAGSIEKARHEAFELRKQAAWALDHGVTVADILAGRLGIKIQDHLNKIGDDDRRALAALFNSFHEAAKQMEGRPGFPRALNAMPNLEGSEFVVLNTLYKPDTENQNYNPAQEWNSQTFKWEHRGRMFAPQEIAQARSQMDMLPRGPALPGRYDWPIYAEPGDTLVDRVNKKLKAAGFLHGINQLPYIQMLAKAPLDVIRVSAAAKSPDPRLRGDLAVVLAWNGEVPIYELPFQPGITHSGRFRTLQGGVEIDTPVHYVRVLLHQLDPAHERFTYEALTAYHARKATALQLLEDPEIQEILATTPASRVPDSVSNEEQEPDWLLHISAAPDKIREAEIAARARPPKTNVVTLSPPSDQTLVMSGPYVAVPQGKFVIIHEESIAPVGIALLSNPEDVLVRIYDPITHQGLFAHMDAGNIQSPLSYSLITDALKLSGFHFKDLQVTLYVRSSETNMRNAGIVLIGLQNDLKIFAQQVVRMDVKRNPNRQYFIFDTKDGSVTQADMTYEKYSSFIRNMTAALREPPYTLARRPLIQLPSPPDSPPSLDETPASLGAVVAQAAGAKPVIVQGPSKSDPTERESSATPRQSLRKRLALATRQLVQEDPSMAKVYPITLLLTFAKRFPSLAEEGLSVFGDDAHLASYLAGSLKPIRKETVPSTKYANPEVLTKLREDIRASGEDRWFIVIDGAGRPRHGKTTLFVGLRDETFPLADHDDIRFLDENSDLGSWLKVIREDPEMRILEGLNAGTKAFETRVNRIAKRNAAALYTLGFEGTLEAIKNGIRTSAKSTSYAAENAWLRAMDDRIIVVNGPESYSLIDEWIRTGVEIPFAHLIRITVTNAGFPARLLSVQTIQPVPKKTPISVPIALDNLLRNAGDTQAENQLKAEGFQVFGIRTSLLKEEPVQTDDIGPARQAAQQQAAALGFNQFQLTARVMSSEPVSKPGDEAIGTVVGELATNFRHSGAEAGLIAMREIQREERPGLEIIFRDLGTGIDDVEQRMQRGNSTEAAKRSLSGAGFSAAREFVTSGGHGEMVIETDGKAYRYTDTGAPEITGSDVTQGTRITLRVFARALPAPLTTRWKPEKGATRWGWLSTIANALPGASLRAGLITTQARWRIGYFRNLDGSLNWPLLKIEIRDLMTLAGFPASKLLAVRVLVVDDKYEARERVIKALRNLPIRLGVVKSEHAEEALDLFRKLPAGSFNLIVTDQNTQSRLLGEDFAVGIKETERERDNALRVPIVLVSDEGFSVARRQEHGLDASFVKGTMNEDAFRRTVGELTGLPLSILPPPPPEQATPEVDEKELRQLATEFGRQLEGPVAALASLNSKEADEETVDTAVKRILQVLDMNLAPAHLYQGPAPRQIQRIHSTLSHDIRNMLGIFQSSTELFGITKDPHDLSAGQQALQILQALLAALRVAQTLPLDENGELDMPALRAMAPPATDSIPQNAFTQNQLDQIAKLPELELEYANQHGDREGLRLFDEHLTTLNLGVHRIASATQSSVYGNASWVVKVAHPALNKQGEYERHMSPIYTVQIADILRREYGSVIPEAYAPLDHEGVLVQQRVNGALLSDLPEEVQRKAEHNARNVSNRAKSLLPAELATKIDIDSNFANFRFDNEGNVISWFDYILRFKTPVTIELPAEIAGEALTFRADDLINQGEVLRYLRNHLPREVYKAIFDVRDDLRQGLVFARPTGDGYEPFKPGERFENNEVIRLVRPGDLTKHPPLAGGTGRGDALEEMVRAQQDRNRVESSISDAFAEPIPVTDLTDYARGAFGESELDPKDLQDVKQQSSFANAAARLLGYNSLLELMRLSGNSEVPIDTNVEFPSSAKLIRDVLQSAGVSHATMNDILDADFKIGETARVPLEARRPMTALANLLGYKASPEEAGEGKTGGQVLMENMWRLKSFTPRPYPFGETGQQTSYVPPYLADMRLPTVANFHIPFLGEVLPEKVSGDPRTTPAIRRGSFGKKTAFTTEPLSGPAWVMNNQLAIKVWIKAQRIYIQRFQVDGEKLTLLDAIPVDVARAVSQQKITVDSDGFLQPFSYSKSQISEYGSDPETIRLNILPRDINADEASPTDTTFRIGLEVNTGVKEHKEVRLYGWRDRSGIAIPAVYDVIDSGPAANGFSSFSTQSVAITPIAALMVYLLKAVLSAAALHQAVNIAATMILPLMGVAIVWALAPLFKGTTMHDFLKSAWDKFMKWFRRDERDRQTMNTVDNAARAVRGETASPAAAMTIFQSQLPADVAARPETRSTLKQLIFKVQA